MIEFNLEDLASFDGKEGRPVYILHKGKVYDVSGSKMWKGGLHMKRHHAGRDLSTDIEAAPHGIEVFERYPQVGVLKQKSISERPIPEYVERLLARFPMLRRHPHPMTVHFPIVFMLFTTIFNLLYLVTGVRSFETTAFHCLGAGLLFTPVVMVTGLFSWWLNYLAKPVKAVTIKLGFSLVLFVTGMLAFTIRIQAPDILVSFGFSSIIYFLLVISFAPIVTIIGWYGAKLTFPIEAE